MEEKIFTLADTLRSLDMNVSVEGGGASIPFIQVDLADGRRLAVGDSGGDWTADIYADDDAMSYGDVLESVYISPCNSSAETIAARVFNIFY